MSNLLQEAIADANKVKEIAYENAKAAIAEAFQPKIQRMISTKLAETGEYEEELPPEMMDDEMTSDIEDIDGEEEESFYEGTDYIDDGDKGVPASSGTHDSLDEEEIDEEFERIIRELEGSDDIQEESDVGYDDNAPSTKKNIGETEGDVSMSVDTEDELDELNLEALIKKLEEEEFGSKQSTPAPSKSPAIDSTDVEALRIENEKLKSENQMAFKAIAEMKSTMNEVNLLNSKLMYSSRIIQNYSLSESQQVKVLETFDRAVSVREVKLIWATIQEHYAGKANRTAKKKKSIAESASRTITTVKARSSENDYMPGASRWQVIAGLKPIND